MEDLVLCVVSPLLKLSLVYFASLSPDYVRLEDALIGLTLL